VKTSEQINELASALAKAQALMKPAKKSEENSYFKSHYADLANIVDNDRKALTANGLSVVQGASFAAHAVEGKEPLFAVAVTTRLMHTSGQWIEETLFAVPKDLGPQAVGIVVAYLRRYGYGSMVGSTAEGEDDDGEAAEGRGTPEGGIPSGWEVAGDLPKSYWSKKDKATLFQSFGPAKDYKVQKIDDKWVALRLPADKATKEQAEKLAEIF
jgi:hypothetical protein